jgi:hypothetical protein
MSPRPGRGRRVCPDSCWGQTAVFGGSLAGIPGRSGDGLFMSGSTPPDSTQVAEEIARGEGLTLAQAARCLPQSRNDKPVSPSTLWRWAHSGVKLADGTRVRLEVARLGCRWLTSRAALVRFLQAQNPAADVPQPKPAPKEKRGGTRARKNREQVEGELRKLGL